MRTSCQRLIDMTKKVYGKPLMFAEEFVPQEYCAPCGDGATQVTYYFVCDGGIPNTYHTVYLESNGYSGLQTSGNPWAGTRADQWLTDTYHPCAQKHTVTVPKGTAIDDIFPKGYLLVQHGYGWGASYETIPVSIWRGENGDNVHVTTALQESEFTPHTPS